MKKQTKITDYYQIIPKGQTLMTHFFNTVRRSPRRSRSPVRRRSRSGSPVRRRSGSPVKNIRSRARSRSVVNSPIICPRPVRRSSPRYYDINVNPCTVCGVDMGPSNPRQLCGKWYCRNNE